LIPAGLDVLHHCDVRLCSNPRHLGVGTKGDNVRDAQSKGRMKRKLVASQIIAMRELHATGASILSIARKFSINWLMAKLIVTGGAWQHLNSADWTPAPIQVVNGEKTMCLRGHPFTEENTRIRTRPGGGRICIACSVLKRRERRARAQKKAA
jgi:hypothetical protein